MLAAPQYTELFNDRTFDARDRFADVFSLLMDSSALTADTRYPQARVHQTELSQKLQALIASHTDTLHALPRDNHYSRHIIGIEESWMGVICRWEANTTSAIHGHPWFAYYQVLEGTLSMDLYEAVDEQHAKTVDTLHMDSGDSIWSKGDMGQYDNMIHKVSTQATEGFTLHLFSENPCLGNHYQLA